MLLFKYMCYYLSLRSVLLAVDALKLAVCAMSVNYTYDNV